MGELCGKDFPFMLEAGLGSRWLLLKHLPPAGIGFLLSGKPALFWLAGLSDILAKPWEGNISLPIII
jgi:hypothetical protein